MRRMKVFFDGGCHPDPGTMEIAVVALGKTIILPDVGQGTSTDAEWLTLIHAIEVGRALGLSDFVLIGDAADIVAKANGAVKCPGSALQYLERFRALASAGIRPCVRHIGRSQNLAGLRLPSVIRGDLGRRSGLAVGQVGEG